jgi:hypothetical protein
MTQVGILTHTRFPIITAAAAAVIVCQMPMTADNDNQPPPKSPAPIVRGVSKRNAANDNETAPRRHQIGPKLSHDTVFGGGRVPASIR